MTQTHTPGPWAIHKTHAEVKTRHVVMGSWGSANVFGDNAEADAALIAAAPETAAERDRLREINAELLTALRIAETRIRAQSNILIETSAKRELLAEAEEIASAAIAKAQDNG